MLTILIIFKDFFIFVLVFYCDGIDFIVKILQTTVKIMRNANIESSVIRAVWTGVEAINKQVLLQLNDTDLVHQIIEQIERASVLSSEDRQSVVDYVSSKVRLIKDLAES